MGAAAGVILILDIDSGREAEGTYSEKSKDLHAVQFTGCKRRRKARASFFFF